MGVRDGALRVGVAAVDDAFEPHLLRRVLCELSGLDAKKRGDNVDERVQSWRSFPVATVRHRSTPAGVATCTARDLPASCWCASCSHGAWSRQG